MLLFFPDSLALGHSVYWAVYSWAPQEPKSQDHELTLVPPGLLKTVIKSSNLVKQQRKPCVFSLFQTILSYCVKYTFPAFISSCNRLLTWFRSWLCLLLSSDHKGSLGWQTDLQVQSEAEPQWENRCRSTQIDERLKNLPCVWTSYGKQIKCCKSSANGIERAGNHSKQNQQ